MPQIWSLNFRLPAGGSCVHVRSIDMADLLGKYGERDLLVHLELAAKGQPTSTNLVIFARPKQMELASKPGIMAKVQADGERSFVVTLETKSPALWTWLELSKMDATFSDNFLHLLPGQKAKILVQPRKVMSVRDFREQLMVRSLVDTYA